MGKTGQIADRLVRSDLVILDELGYLPFSASGGALLFHLLSKLYERASVAITTNLAVTLHESVRIPHFRTVAAGNGETKTGFRRVFAANMRMKDGRRRAA